MSTGDQRRVFGAAEVRHGNPKSFSLHDGRIAGILLITATILTWLTPAVHAQFTADYQTNVISGVTSNWSGDYRLDHLSSFLRIDSGGALFDNIGYVIGSNDSVLVTGSGSVWSNGANLYVGLGIPSGRSGSSVMGDSLVISNGGRVVDVRCNIDTTTPYNFSSNSVLVTGHGSVWSNQTDVYVGSKSSGNSVVVSDGGQVFATNAYVGGAYGGFLDGGSNNTVVITGSGSGWSTLGEMTIGHGGMSNIMVISNGGQVLSGLSGIGDIWGSSNLVVVTGPGSVWSVRSHLRIGYVSLGSGAGIGNSLVISNGGMVMASSMPIYSTNSVTLSGGTLVLTNGLTTYADSLLMGSGTIRANVTLGGMLSPGNSPGALTNFGNLTLQPTAVMHFELGGTNQGSGYDFLLVTNGVVTLNGLLEVKFIDGFATNVLHSDIFTVLAASSTINGAFANVLNGQRLTTEDGEGSFVVSYSPHYLTLSDYMEIPEPSTVYLCVVGLGCLGLGRQRRRYGALRTPVRLRKDVPQLHGFPR